MINYDELQPTMNELELEIYKQVTYCVGMKKFRSAICIASEDKREIVKELLMKIIKENTLQFTTKFCFGYYSTYVEFSNGSSIKTIVPNEDVRGIRFDSCIIDNEIFDSDKKELIYSKLIPLINSDMEPMNVLEEMINKIRIVEIEGDRNAST